MYKSTFIVTLLILCVWVSFSTLYIQNIEAYKEAEVYDLQYQIEKLKTENKQLRLVQKQCFEERQKARRGSAVKDYK